jgi:hypothetical protein
VVALGAQVVELDAPSLETYFPGMSLVGRKIASSNLANIVSARYSHLMITRMQI